MKATELATALKTVLSAAQSSLLVSAARKDSVLRRQLELYAGGLSQPAMRGAIQQHLEALLPADDDASELAALLAQPLPADPRKTAKTKTRKPAKPTARTLGKPKPTAKPTAPAGSKADWTGQAPISESTGNPLPWWQSQATGRDGNVYFNFGRKGYGKSIGCTLEVWRELLSNADELLADLEDFAS